MCQFWWYCGQNLILSLPYNPPPFIIEEKKEIDIFENIYISWKRLQDASKYSSGLKTKLGKPKYLKKKFFEKSVYIIFILKKRWHMTCNIWQLTSDMWHFTCDIWNATHDGESTFFQMSPETLFATPDTRHLQHDMCLLVHRWGVKILSKFQVPSFNGFWVMICWINVSQEWTYIKLDLL